MTAGGACRWCGSEEPAADVQAVGVILSGSGPGGTIWGCGSCREKKGIVRLADQVGDGGLPQTADGTPVR